MKTIRGSNATNSNNNLRSTKKNCPAEQARKAAGFTLEQAAKAMKLAPRYLRQLECSGNTPLNTARRLGRLYGCSSNIFIHPPEYLVELGQRTISASIAPPTASIDTEQQLSASRRHRPFGPPKLSLVPAQESEVHATDARVKRPSFTLVNSTEFATNRELEAKTPRQNAASHWSRRQHEEDAFLIERMETAKNTGKSGI